MFGSIGPQEVLIVLVIALVVLGPSKLPEVARSLGKGVKEFKEGLSEQLGDDLEVEHEPDETDEPERARVHELPPAAPAPALPPATAVGSPARDDETA